MGRGRLAERLTRWLGTRSFLRGALVLILTCLGCAALLAELPGSLGREWTEGEVAERDVVAPFTFAWVNEAATRARQDAAEAQVAPVFEADLALGKRLESRVAQAFDMARRRWENLEGAPQKPDPEAVAALRGDFLGALDLPIDPADVDLIVKAGFSPEIEGLAIELIGVAMRKHILEERSALPSPPRPVTVVSVAGESREESTLDDYAQLRTPDEARQAVSLYVVERFGSSSRESVRAAAAIARASVRSTLRYDEPATLARRAAARRTVEPVEQRVRKGSRIVRAGDELTAEQVRQLRGMASRDRSRGGWLGFAGWAAFVGMLVSATVFFASSTIRKFPHRASDREALAFTLVLVLLVGRLLGASAAAIELPTAWDADAVSLLVPVAGGAMLVRILLNSESALIWSVLASVLASAMTERSAQMAAYFLITSMVATTGVGPARERWIVLRAGLQAGAVGAVFVTVVALMPGAGGVLPDGRALLGLAGTAMLGGLLGAVLTLGIVPAFEVFGFVTDYKLLELASLNHPLLRQLMLRAPGTYHHSVIVGSLSEAACEAIGANALLARVACYFHDIGKGLKPQYFVENQMGVPNRHDRLSPAQSAQLIINHVREGAVLARQYKLPRPIYDNIFMHHGTGLISYFHDRAKELTPDEPIDEALFRYPGPKPDTREAGIIMLADKVEAACRTIKEPTEDRIRAMIQQIINGVMNDGQLENCPITLKELYQIADTFTTVIQGIYHHRIEYPSTRSISSGKGRFVPVPRQGTITLEIVNPLKAPPPLGSGTAPPPEDRAAGDDT